MAVTFVMQTSIAYDQLLVGSCLLAASYLVRRHIRGLASLLGLGGVAHIICALAHPWLDPDWVLAVQVCSILVAAFAMLRYRQDLQALLGGS
jgi:hypothetical protein